MTIKRAKRGDPFLLTVTRRDDAGAIVNLSGMTAASKMRSGLAEIVLDAQVTNPAGGVVTLSASAAATALWTPGLYSSDVEYRVDGLSIGSSETFEILVVEDVT